MSLDQSTDDLHLQPDCEEWNSDHSGSDADTEHSLESEREAPSEPDYGDDSFWMDSVEIATTETRLAQLLREQHSDVQPEPVADWRAAVDRNDDPEAGEPTLAMSDDSVTPDEVSDHPHNAMGDPATPGTPDSPSTAATDPPAIETSATETSAFVSNTMTTTDPAIGVSGGDSDAEENDSPATAVTTESDEEYESLPGDLPPRSDSRQGDAEPPTWTPQPLVLSYVDLHEQNDHRSGGRNDNSDDEYEAFDVEGELPEGYYDASSLASQPGANGVSIDSSSDGRLDMERPTNDDTQVGAVATEASERAESSEPSEVTEESESGEELATTAQPVAMEANSDHVSLGEPPAYSFLPEIHPGAHPPHYHADRRPPAYPYPPESATEDEEEDLDGVRYPTPALSEESLVSLSLEQEQAIDRRIERRNHGRFCPCNWCSLFYGHTSVNATRGDVAAGHGGLNTVPSGHLATLPLDNNLAEAQMEGERESRRRRHGLWCVLATAVRCLGSRMSGMYHLMKFAVRRLGRMGRPTRVCLMLCECLASALSGFSRLFLLLSLPCYAVLSASERSQ